MNNIDKLDSSICRINNAETIKELWSKTYNTEGRPDWSHNLISFLAEYDLFKNIKKTEWYDEFIAELENNILQVLSDSIYPMLKDKIITRFSFSPLSIENRIGSSEGAIIFWSFQQPVPVLNIIQHADRSVLTPVPSIFQAGQWAYSPAGVPMSILIRRKSTQFKRLSHSPNI